MLAWYCCMVRVINQEAKGLDSNSTLPYVGCVRYHKIVGLDLPNSFNFTSTTSALCECTNSSADLHPSKQPTRSFLKCGGLLHQNFLCFRFQCLFLSTAGRKESQRGGEERPTSQKTIEGWIFVQVAREIAYLFHCQFKVVFVRNI